MRYPHFYLKCFNNRIWANEVCTLSAILITSFREFVNKNDLTLIPCAWFSLSESIPNAVTEYYIWVRWWAEYSKTDLLLRREVQWLQRKYSVTSALPKSLWGMTARGWVHPYCIRWWTFLYILNCSAPSVLFYWSLQDLQAPRPYPSRLLR